MDDLDDTSNQSLDDAFEHLEKERLAALMKILTRTLIKQVMSRCSKVLELGPFVAIDLPTPTNPSPIKIGRFPLDPTMVSTYELHLTMQPTNQVKLKLANLMRRLQGKKAKLVVDDKFSLVKKKLYRSSTSER